MDSTFPQFDDENNSDVKLQIIFSDDHQYNAANPIHLYSPVLVKSKYLEARLSERWSSTDTSSSSSSDIILTFPEDGSAEDCIDCIRLMYSSQWVTHLSFSTFDDALHILPVASELLFDEGIQASTEYLEAVCWTPEQKLRIQDLHSSSKIIISTDLAERLKITKPKSLFDEELGHLKNKLSQMFSKTFKSESVTYCLSLQHKQKILKKQIAAYFEEDIHPAIQNICRDALLEEFKRKTEVIRCGSYKCMERMNSACESLLWLLDLIKLCKRDVFEVAFTSFVEDEGIANILVQHPENLQSLCARSCFLRLVLKILVHRFLDTLANGDIIISKSARVSFMVKWVPIIATLICWHDRVKCGSVIGEFWERLEGGVTKILARLSLVDQSKIVDSFHERVADLDTSDRKTFRWWIDVIWMALMAANGSHLQIE